jgi:hypothetical protein
MVWMRRGYTERMNGMDEKGLQRGLREWMKRGYTERMNGMDEEGL